MSEFLNFVRVIMQLQDCATPLGDGKVHDLANKDIIIVYRVVYVIRLQIAAALKVDSLKRILKWHVTFRDWRPARISL